MDETLIECVAQGTGLPKEKIEEVLKNWIIESGKSPQDIKLEDLREVLVGLIQNLFAEVASGENEFIQLSR